MEQEVKQANQMPQEEEIDLVEVVRKLWKNRKLILKITVVFMVLGVLVALFSPKNILLDVRWSLNPGIRKLVEI